MSFTTTPRAGRSNWATGIIAFATVAAAGALGSIATTPNIPGWYAGLTKPSFNPPNWIFGPVWTLLYLMMAYAFHRILMAPDSADRNRAIAAFIVQIVANAAWSWAFFAAHSPLLGLVVIAVLWCAIVATIILFGKIDVLAVWLLGPYIIWVSFAYLLNIAIWRLN